MRVIFTILDLKTSKQYEGQGLYLSDTWQASNTYKGQLISDFVARLAFFAYLTSEMGHQFTPWHRRKRNVIDETRDQLAYCLGCCQLTRLVWLSVSFYLPPHSSYFTGYTLPVLFLSFCLCVLSYLTLSASSRCYFISSNACLSQR